jgi:hypothetical protein
MSKKQKNFLIIFVISFIYLIAYILLFIFLKKDNYDFNIFYKSVENFYINKNPYNTPNGNRLGFIYPPFALIFMLYLKLLPVIATKLISAILLIICTFVTSTCAYILLKNNKFVNVKLKKYIKLPIIFLVFLLSPMFIDNFNTLNASIFPNMLVILTFTLLYLSQKKCSRRANKCKVSPLNKQYTKVIHKIQKIIFSKYFIPIPLSIGAGFKLLPLIFVPVLWIVNAKKEAILSVLYFIGTIFIGAIILPFNLSVHFWKNILSIININGNTWTPNSIADVFNRIGLQNNTTLYNVKNIICIIIILYCYFIMHKIYKKTNSIDTFFIFIGIVTAFQTIASPTSYLHHILLIMLLLFVKVSNNIKWQKLYFIIAFILLYIKDIGKILYYIFMHINAPISLFVIFIYAPITIFCIYASTVLPLKIYKLQNKKMKLKQC